MRAFVVTFLKLQTIFFFLAVHVIADERQTREDASSTQSEMIDKLFVNYDNRIRPGFGKDHLNVTVKIYILPWFEVDELRMEYSLTIILIQTWTDERLTFQHDSIKSIMLNGEHMKPVWVPDTYIKNERKSHLHDITYPNEFVKIQSDGKVALEMRSSMTLGCNSPVDLSEEFPFDFHYCMFTLESFQGKDAEIMYHWDKEVEGEGVVLHPSAHTAAGSFSVNKLTEYHELEMMYHEDITHDDGSLAKWLIQPGLSAEILFQRALQPYITSVYIPLIIFTSISILSLGALNAKISSFLNFFNIAFINIFMALRFNSQNMIWTTKATALDKYLNICNLFIICCAIVNIVIIYMENTKRKGQENIELRDVQQPSTENDINNYFNTGIGSESENLFNRPRNDSFITSRNIVIAKIRQWTKKVPEAISLFCEFSSWTFAGAFVVANAFYWAKHL